MIDILQVLENEGIELRRQGREYVCKCVFHDDHHPSMSVNAEKGVYFCWACGAKGDALTFTMNYRGLTFPQAKKYLGIEDNGDDLDIAVAKERAKTRQAFRVWCKNETQRLLNLTIDIYEVLNKAKTENVLGVDSMCADIRNLEKYNYHLDILTGHNERAKIELYRTARELQHR